MRCGAPTGSVSAMGFVWNMAALGGSVAALAAVLLAREVWEWMNR